MDFSDMLSQMSDAELDAYLSQLMQGGALGDRSAIVQGRLDELRSDMGRPSPEYSTPLGALVGGIGDVASAYRGGKETERLRGEQQRIIDQQTEMRKVQAKALADMLRRGRQPDAPSAPVIPDYFMRKPY